MIQSGKEEENQTLTSRSSDKRKICLLNIRCGSALLFLGKEKPNSLKTVIDTSNIISVPSPEEDFGLGQQRWSRRRWSDGCLVQR